MASKHFVLVHGTCHGAWCWYKVKPLLESAGHKVTALDMAASGINERKIEEVYTFQDYNAPLINFMRSVPIDQKVILVGHSFGGLNLSFATDKFFEKIYVAVFIAALMPDLNHKPSYIVEELLERTPTWVDTKFEPSGPPTMNHVSALFGPQFISEKLYNLSSPEDKALAIFLMRPSSLFSKDLANYSLSNEGYGKVSKVYIICTEDKIITHDFQKWLIGNMKDVNVKIMHGIDHMPMLSAPRDLSKLLLEVASKYD